MTDAAVPLDRWTVVGCAEVALACVDLRLDLAIAGFPPSSSGRTGIALLLLAVGLVGVAVAGAARRRRGRPALGELLSRRLRPARARTGATVAAASAVLAGCAYLLLSAIVLLPLAEAPGYSLGRIYAAVGRVEGAGQLAADVAQPVVVCSVLAAVIVATAVLLIRLRVPWPWVVVLALASFTALAVAGFLLGFSFGTDVPDVLPPGAGVSPASDDVFRVLSQVALLAALPIAVASAPQPVARETVPAA